MGGAFWKMYSNIYKRPERVPSLFFLCAQSLRAAAFLLCDGGGRSLTVFLPHLPSFSALQSFRLNDPRSSDQQFEQFFFSSSFSVSDEFCFNQIQTRHSNGNQSRGRKISTTRSSSSKHWGDLSSMRSYKCVKRNGRNTQKGQSSSLGWLRQQFPSSTQLLHLFLSSKYIHTHIYWNILDS